MAAPPPRSGCSRVLARGVLALVALALGGLGWDVWQLRQLRPPEDSTFDGFVRSGRAGSLLLDATSDRLYWIAAPPPTIIRSPAPPAYEFNRSGVLLNWTPGSEKGMILEAPVHPRGSAVSVDDARRWIHPRR